MNYTVHSDDDTYTIENACYYMLDNEGNVHFQDKNSNRIATVKDWNAVIADEEFEQEDEEEQKEENNKCERRCITQEEFDIIVKIAQKLCKSRQ